MTNQEILEIIKAENISAEDKMFIFEQENVSFKKVLRLMLGVMEDDKD